MTSQLTGVWGGTPNDRITFTTPAGNALTGTVLIAGDRWLYCRVSKPNVYTLVNRTEITNVPTPDCRRPN